MLKITMKTNREILNPHIKHKWDNVPIKTFHDLNHKRIDEYIS
jgi:hypothetical protein